MDTARLMGFLAPEGFRPALAAGGEIRFKYEGGNYLIRISPDHDQYVAIAYPNFWQLGSPEETVRAFHAAYQAVQWI